MPTEFTIAEIVSLEKVAQYLSSQKIANNVIFKGTTADITYTKKIYSIRKAVEFVYNANPSYGTLRKVAEYLYALLGPYGLQAQNVINGLAVGLPVLTGPTNQTVNEGQTATFTVSVAGTGPFTYQWYLAGVPLSGENGPQLQITNAQLSQSGNQYTVSVTNAGGTANSNPATLTVNNALTGYFAYMDIDPGPTLTGGTDPFAYQESFAITTGQPWTMPVPGASTPLKYIVVKGPSSEPVKTAWNNGGVNTGLLPDLDWAAPIVIASTRYYYTKLLFSLDPLNNLTLS